MEKIELNVMDGETREIVIREGEAAPLRLPKGYSLTGTLSSVIDYYNKRENAGIQIDPKNSLLIVSVANRTVELQIQKEIVEETITLKGVLIKNKDYQELGINTTVKHTEKDLEMLLRKRPHLFESTIAYRDTLNALRNFTMKVDGETKKADNQRGNVASSASLNVETNMQKELPLLVTPWQGVEPMLTGIDVLVSLESGSPRFFLESIPLMLEEERQAELELNKVVEALAELPVIFT
jgi:hypothetical protein